MNDKELHLFIIWSRALEAKDRILEDIQDKFTLVSCIEVAWSKPRFSDNLSRFYGEKLPPNSSKEKHCGSDPFLVVVVEDTLPRYEVRNTSKGVAVVNANMFDSKNLYRSWTGGGHKIHGTDNSWETRHNLALLFGKSINDRESLASLDGKVYSEDLVGADGWNSLDQLFSVLNAVSNYVVLRNFENLSDELDQLHPDIDLLTDDQRMVAEVINGKKTKSEPYRAQYATMVEGKKTFFDLRFVGDGYYDKNWQFNILKERVRHENFYVPNALDHFYSLMYHAYIHKRGLHEDYLWRIKELSESSKVNLNYDLTDFVGNRVLDDLNSFLLSKGYSYTIPEDITVFFNNEVIRRYQSFTLSKERVRREIMHKYELKLKSLVRKTVFKILGKRI